MHVYVHVCGVCVLTVINTTDKAGARAKEIFPSVSYTINVREIPYMDCTKVSKQIAN